MVEDKYVGLAIALVSNFAIGTSFTITKRGLMEESDQNEFDGEGFSYLRNATWWAGMITMVIGEIGNFAAYAFAPAILVTPLGALAVLVGAVLGSYILKEELGILGKLGCAICLLGSIIIVLHAPADEEVETVDQLLDYAIQPAFLIYVFIVTVFSLVMIYQISPKYGRKNPLIYISICSTVGSVSVMSIKAFGIALKLTLRGDNQFTHASTYVFVIVVVVCILTQMNYFNKALAQFPTSLVNPLYYVMFTTATLCASFILFKGFNTSDAVNTISLLCGFLVIFGGVYLLNLSRTDPNGHKLLQGHDTGDGVPTDLISTFETRRSMQLRRSFGVESPLRSAHRHHRHPSDSLGSGQNRRRSAETSLMASFDADQEERALGLTELTEARSREEDDGEGRTSIERERSKERRRADERLLHAGNGSARPNKDPDNRLPSHFSRR